MLVWLVAAALAQLPTCIEPDGSSTPQSRLMPTEPADAEVLARLVYAEATSTGFPEDPAVHRGIAWGAMNRVRISEVSPRSAGWYGKTIPGVVFKRGQFNPAVSPTSKFSREFLCPEDEARWTLATTAAGEAIAGKDNPFIQTEWEKTHGLSLVVNFYYPKSIQARGPLAPWEHDGNFTFLGDIMLGDAALPAERVRFYRRRRAPTDLNR